RQAEPAGHRAPDLGRDAERIAWCRRGCVGNEDRLDPPAVAELEEEFTRSVSRDLVGDDLRRRHAELGFEPRAEGPRKICHPVELRHAVAVDPSVELSRVEPLAVPVLKGDFQLVELQLGQVGTWGGHRYLLRFLANAGVRL